MKKLISLFMALIATTALWASGTLTYTATDRSTGYYGLLEEGSTILGPTIVSHTFANGIGTITCDGEITTIGNDAFNACRFMTSIEIPNSVTTIGDRAFYFCEGLTSITIPNSVTSIGMGAFLNCVSLKSVTIPHSVTTIGREAFAGCIGLTSVTIPDSVTTIGEEAFVSCANLTSVTIGNSVTTIGDGAFGYTGLKSVTIPNSVTTIGMASFGACANLTSVTIGNSVTSIGDYAFNSCYNLMDVTVAWTDADKLPTMGEEVFFEIANEEGPSAATLHIPAGTKSIYEVADQWKEFGTIADDFMPSTDLNSLKKMERKGSKFFHNGSLIIERNSIQYISTGQEVR